MTTASEVVQDLLGRGGDSWFGGDLLAAEGDRGGAQRPEGSYDLVDGQAGGYARPGADNNIAETVHAPLLGHRTEERATLTVLPAAEAAQAVYRK